MLRLLGEMVAALLAPERCAACDGGVPLQTVFCPACSASIVPAPFAPRAAAVGIYGGALATAVRALKYGDRPDLARPLGDLLARAATAALARGGADRVVPVPLGPARLVERGYDQAALLASRASRAWGIPWSPRALRRVRETLPQAALDRTGRLENVRGAFEASVSLGGARVVLVDDVLTSGATTAAAADAIRDAGGRVVLVATVAVAERGASQSASQNEAEAGEPR